MQKTKTQTKRSASAASAAKHGSSVAARSSAANLEAPADKPTAAPAVEHHKELRAETFTLVDPEGNRRAHLTTRDNDTILAMYDHHHRLRLSLRASENEALLRVFSDPDGDGDGDAVASVEIGYEPGLRKPRIVISDGNENQCVVLSHDGGGSGHASFYGGRRDERVMVDSEGVGVFDRSGRPLAELGAPDSRAEEAEKGAKTPLVEDEDRDDDEEADRAVEALANAFATIREYWDYVPRELERCALEALSTETLNSVRWEDDPVTSREIYTTLLRASFRGDDKPEEEAA